MIIRVEAESDIPIYTQLINQIIEGIARGDMHSGDSLPSVRTLAADLSVNMHTVNKSYHELEKKGIIRIAPKSRAVISSPKTFDPSSFQRLSTEFRPLVAEAIVLGMEKEEIHELVELIISNIKERK